jgi:N6-adenosine-specific RNA methylase IME4
MTEEIVLSAAQFTPTGWTPTKDLSYDEWYEVGFKIAKVGAAVNWWIGDWIRYGEHEYGEKYAQALELFDGQYEEQTLRLMTSIANRVSLLNRFNKLSWTHHIEIAKLEPDEQAALLGAAEQHSMSVRELREAVRDYKRNVWLTDKGADLEATDITELPTRIYRIIYADPPWQYGNGVPLGTTRPDNYYPTMPTEEIAALPVSKLAADDAVLFLWSTSPHLPEALDVAGAWGFEYKTSFIWDKVKHNMGHYNSVRHELLLVCTRGICPPDVQKLHDSVVVEERGEHSAKPEIFREIIDGLYVHGRRVELFARDKRGNWDVWGNQVR